MEVCISIPDEHKCKKTSTKYQQIESSNISERSSDLIRLDLPQGFRGGLTLQLTNNTHHTNKMIDKIMIITIYRNNTSDRLQHPSMKLFLFLSATLIISPKLVQQSSATVPNASFCYVSVLWPCIIDNGRKSSVLLFSV